MCLKKWKIENLLTFPINITNNFQFNEFKLASVQKFFSWMNTSSSKDFHQKMRPIFATDETAMNQNLREWSDTTIRYRSNEISMCVCATQGDLVSPSQSAFSVDCDLLVSPAVWHFLFPRPKIGSFEHWIIWTLCSTSEFQVMFRFQIIVK